MTKPQRDPHLLVRQAGDALGIREHARKQPEFGGGRTYLRSAISTAQHADFIRYDKTRGSGRLQFYNSATGGFTVTNVSGDQIYTHFHLSERAAQGMGFGR